MFLPKTILSQINLMIWNGDIEYWLVLVIVFAIGAGICVLAAWLIRQDRLYDLVNKIGTFRLLPTARQRRLARLLKQPFPEEWADYLHRNVRVYSALTLAEQEKVRNSIKVLVAEMNWEGCKGLELTPEIEVTIAAQASILGLGFKDEYFSEVPSILVYPSAFRSPSGSHGPEGTIQGGVGTLGEAWYRGPVILSWPEVLEGGRNPGNGKNLVYHEFAHQLDFFGKWGSSLSSHQARKEWRKWEKVMNASFHRLQKAVEGGETTFLDPYGATNTSEFFAVATECFFEKPIEMKEMEADLFEVLKKFYNQDPLPRRLKS